MDPIPRYPASPLPPLASVAQGTWTAIWASSQAEVAGALERGQLLIQQLGVVMGRAVVLQDRDDHGVVGVFETGGHPEWDQRAVLAAADHQLARAIGDLARA
jgi:hypothetical protein